MTPPPLASPRRAALGFIFVTALLDVDLYRPILAVLDALYDRLPPGAIIVVDDCEPGSFDGALQAFDEFVAARGLPRRIERGKLGVIEKA